jgi:putative tricarboxylic transport membrane protein
VGTQAIKVFSLITKIPQAILFPVTLILCCVGTYGVNSSFFDVGVMGVFGLAGYFLRRHAFPMAPLLIAFILEPIGERALRQTLSLSDGDLSIFVTKPISLFFLLLAVFVAVLTNKKALINKKG